MNNIQRYCIYCGTKLREKAKFCEGCGKEPFSEEKMKQTLRKELIPILEMEIRKKIDKEQGFNIKLTWKVIIVEIVIVVCALLILIAGKILGII